MKEVFFHFFKTGIFKGIFGTGLKVKMTFMHKLKAMQSSGINGLRQFWASILVSFFGLQGLMAVEVTYVGKEVSDGSSSYAVQNWSLTSVGKQFNTLSGQERYGTAGYYQIRPTLNSSPQNISDVVPSGNDLGQTAGSEATLSYPPLFVSSITGGAGTLVNLDGYSTYLGSDGTTIYRQGGLSVSVGNGPNNSPAGENSGYFGEVLQFTLGTSAKFRIGLAVDSVGTANHGPGIYSPDYVSIYNNAIGSVFSTALTRDGNPDMVFFDIEGNAGDSFTVGLWQNTGSHSVAVLSLVTFDVNQAATDTNPPVIELNGATSVSVDWGGLYTDEGATASDDVDSVVTVIPSGAVDTSKPGVYTITFDATDASGNSATQVIRTVTVSAPSSTTDADGLSGLMRYALGGNAPGDSVTKPSSSVIGEYLVITAIVRTDNPKLTVVGQAVTNLGNYASGTSVVEVLGVDAADQGGVPVGSKRRTFSVTLEGSVTKKFLRLKASLAQ